MSKKRRGGVWPTTAVGLLVALGATGRAGAIEINVGPGESIQTAIVAAGLDDEVVVAPGTYDEAIDFLGKNIVVRSTGGAAVTTINASGLGTSAVSFVGGESADAMLVGFTVRAGFGTLVEIAPDVFRRLGGGLYADGSDPTVRRCVFRGNGGDLGAGMYLRSSDASIESCLVFGNLATFDGGGILVSIGSAPSITSCTITQNNANLGFGGGLHVEGGMPVVVNSIVWANQDLDGQGSSSQINVQSGSAVVNHSLVTGGWGGAGGVGIVIANPDFADAVGGDYRLDDFSPAVDAGDSASVPVALTTDLDGNPRVVDDGGVTDTGLGGPPVVDLGAYERPVNSETPLATVPEPFLTIQEGINAVAPGGEVVVAAGTYPERIDLLGKPMTVRTTAGPALTIIDGSGGGDVIVADSGEGPDTVIQGFLITGGEPPNGSGLFVCASGPTVIGCTFATNHAGLGGGMRCVDGATPIVNDCLFEGNEAGLGGAVYAEASAPVVTGCLFDANTAGVGGAVYNLMGSTSILDDCTFTGNTALGSGFGGAIYNSESSSPIFRGCTIANNFAIDGGGMFNGGGSMPIVASCTFAGNDAVNKGGAMANVSGSTPLIVNVVFTGNTSRFGGGLDNRSGGAPVVANCTFSGNDGEFGGGTVYNAIAVGVTTITNCVLWGNTPDEIVEPFGIGLFVATSIVDGGWPGADVLEVDPLFIDPDGADDELGTVDDDLRLGAGSPAIDRGVNAGVPPDGADLDGDADDTEVTPLDRGGAPRFQDDPDVPNGGVGTPPLVDLGAFEAPGDTVLCPTDLDGDGSTGFADVLAVFAAWGPCVGCPEDVDGDGAVGFSDLLLVLTLWGPC